MPTILDILERADLIEGNLKKWTERSERVTRLLNQIESGEKQVHNPTEIALYLSFILITLDLAMVGDEDAIRLLLIESGSHAITKQKKKRVRKPKLSVNTPELCEM